MHTVSRVRNPSKSVSEYCRTLVRHELAIVAAILRSHYRGAARLGDWTSGGVRCIAY
jgi:hypothetical protein